MKGAFVRHFILASSLLAPMALSAAEERAIAPRGTPAYTTASRCESIRPTGMVALRDLEVVVLKKTPCATINYAVVRVLEPGAGPTITTVRYDDLVPLGPSEE